MAGATPRTPDAILKSQRTLRDFGVGKRASAELGKRFTAEVVERGILWVADNKDHNTFSPPGLLVTALRDGTIEELWRAEAPARAARAGALRKKRREAMKEAFSRLTNTTDAASASWFQERAPTIRAVWPDTKALADAGVVADAVLLAQPLNPLLVIEGAYRAARARAQAKEGVSK